MPTFPLNIRALGSATRAYSTSILHIQLLLPLALLLQQRWLMHCFNVPLIQRITTHWCSNRDSTGTAGNLRGGESINIRHINTGTYYSNYFAQWLHCSGCSLCMSVSNSPHLFLSYYLHICLYFTYLTPQKYYDNKANDTFLHLFHDFCHFSVATSFRDSRYCFKHHLKHSIP